MGIVSRREAALRAEASRVAKGLMWWAPLAALRVNHVGRPSRQAEASGHLL
jgi:hypothetical protein